MSCRYRTYIIVFLVISAGSIVACPLCLATDHKERPFFYDEDTDYFKEHIFDQ